MSDGYEEDFIEEPNLFVNESEKPIFFDIMNQHLHIPLGLMKEILKDMETIKNN